MKKCNMSLFIRIFTNVFPIIWRFITTVSEHFMDTLRTIQDSWGFIRQNENSFWEIHKYFKMLYGWYRFLFDRNDYHADRFQIVRDCSIVSIVNNRKDIRLKGLSQIHRAPYDFRTRRLAEEFRDRAGPFRISFLRRSWSHIQRSPDDAR